jgi:hypothetical protein
MAGAGDRAKAKTKEDTRHPRRKRDDKDEKPPLPGVSKTRASHDLGVLQFLRGGGREKRDKDRDNPSLTP